jgi:signal peptidase complex subunit 3
MLRTPAGNPRELTIALPSRSRAHKNTPCQEKRRICFSQLQIDSQLNMHSFWSRLNAVIFFGLYVLGFLASLCAFSTYNHFPDPTAQLKVNTLKSLRNHAGVDRALLTFDMQADLTSVFNWNTKQLFCFIVAEYKSKSNDLNQVVMWDKVVASPAEAKLTLKNVFNKYMLVDEHDELRSADVQLRLVWDIMPTSGRLFMHTLHGEKSFGLPEEYV